MRRQHWSAPVLSMLLCLAGGASVLAQSDAPGGEYSLAYAEALPREPRYHSGGPYVDPDGDPWGHPAPVPYVADPYASMAFGQQGYAPTHHQVSVGPVGGAAYQPQLRPYPEISPFAEEQFNQHIVEDGLWMNDFNSRGRDYYFILQGVYSRMRKPGRRLVGNNDPTIPPFDDPATPLIEFPKFKIGEQGFRHDQKSEGILGRFGFWNPDDSGLMFEGFWISDVTDTFRDGPRNRNDPLALKNTFGIPLDDGAGGVTVPYATGFNLLYSQEAFGLSATWYHTPWLKSNVYHVRLLTGVRYLHIQGQFGFQGSDNGFTAAFDPQTGEAIPGTVGPNPSGNPPWEAFLESRAYSHLFGPEIGLQYDLGGRSLKVGGHTKIALAGNIERNMLEGNNIGDGFVRGIGGFGINNPFPENNPFSYKDYTGHISPIFEQNLFFELNVFGYMPYLKRWQLLEDAKVRVDYTLLYASEISRPENNIVWRGLPEFPEMKISRSQWHMSNWNFGIIWDF